MAKPKPTDSELLMQFAEDRDSAAFQTLVERHAGLVQTVCRRVLNNSHDVEDAFQATFLVLASNAASIRCRDSVVSWLFKVAHRTAVRAAMNRHTHKTERIQVEPSIDADQLEAIQERETFEVLVAELNRLPEKYRAPLILTYGFLY